MNIPKHSVILWLTMLNMLKTKERLIKVGLQMEDCCSLCRMEKENLKHLYFACTITGQWLQEIKDCLGGWLEQRT